VRGGLLLLLLLLLLGRCLCATLAAFNRPSLLGCQGDCLLCQGVQTSCAASKATVLSLLC
jgi:hypothetical protein